MGKLKNSDISINCESHISKTHSQFIAHSNRISLEYFNRLKKTIPELEGYQFVYEPMNYMCAETDFSIVVAGK